ncbi:three-Cys-motif partner protein TcmP [Treponema sp. OMZ 787]|uniref:three-Cys-motif partner protein TcmP n=1 Tax=Treponema sp. OMZ 787 TaxID=2563669 RepID=UPI0020A2FFDB|nr:three-Cys-motif partner protein TcmP [Treponema sp. OMZ 787]
MPNMHKKKFDEGTEVKLELFKTYMKAWIPIVNMTNSKTVYIYDLFSGPGKDAKNSKGSPLILLDILMENCQGIKETYFEILFNDALKQNIERLKTECNKAIEDCKKTNSCVNTCPFHITYKQNDFQNIFPNVVEEIKTNGNPFSFIFLDQYGIKHVDKENFLKLLPLKKTDVLFFSASADVWRFRETEAFKKYIDINKITFTKEKYPYCHKILVDYYKSLVPNHLKENLYIAPFSIKKEKSGMIYGLTFITHNLLGLEKFISAAWKIAPDTGEANYNIENGKIEQNIGQMLLFDEPSKKLDLYQNDICVFLKKGRTNKEIYEYSLVQGVSLTETNNILKRLEDSNSIKITVIGEEKRRKHAYYLNFKTEEKVKIYYEQHKN